MIKLKVTTKLKEKMPQWYYGKAYENYDTNTVVWAVIGLHTIIKIVRYSHQVWNIWRGRKTWFDKQWLDAYTLGINAGYFQRVNEENHNKFLLEELRMKLKLPKTEGIQNERFN